MRSIPFGVLKTKCLRNDALKYKPNLNLILFTDFCCADGFLRFFTNDEEKIDIFFFVKDLSFCKISKNLLIQLIISDSIFFSRRLV